MKKKIKAFLVNISKKNSAFRKLFRSSLNKYRTIKYKKYNQMDINEKLIIFESFMGRSYTDTPKAMYEYMINSGQFDDYTFVWAFKKPEEKAKYFTDSKTKLVKWGSDEYYKYYATAKYWVSNSMVPIHVEKRPGQIYVQTWHGTPLKKLRYDIEVSGSVLNDVDDIRKRNDQDACRFDYFISPSPFASEKFTSAFNLKGLNKEGIIIEEGYPRNDFLFNYTEKDVLGIKENLNLPDDKKIILYAPTFRDDQHKSGVGYTYNLELDFDKLQKEIGSDYIILFRTHYFVSNMFDFNKYEGFIYDVSSYDDINHLYVISDLLITDYSSVFFDYANLNRPILFYMYDLDNYQNNLRDFYISLDELPMPIIKKEDELIRAIQSVEDDFKDYKVRYAQFNKKFNDLDDGEATKRVVAEIFK